MPRQKYGSFDWDKFERLCALPPVISQEDIAFVMGCSVDTCDREIKKRYKGMKFAEFRGQKGANLRIAIINKQYQVALAGNTTMLIWLGKQYLGQSDKTEISGNAQIETKWVDEE